MITETEGHSVMAPVSQPDAVVTGIGRNLSAVPWVLQFVRGSGLAGLLAAVVLSLALMTGVVDGISLVILPVAVVFPVAAVGAVAFVLIPDRDSVSQTIGVVSVGAVSLIVGVVTGFGALEISGILGSVAALAVLRVDTPDKMVVPLGVVAAIVIALVVINLTPLVLDGGGLNHDESAYALKARHWVEGTPETGWNLHRGIAMSAYGYLIFELGGDEAALRLLGLVAIVGFAAAVWVLGKRVGGKWVGPLATMALLSSPILLRRSTEYLSDVPSSALLVAVMVVVWRHFGERERPGYGLMWLLPFAWLSFYLRYQSALSFLLIAISIGVLFWEKVKLGWRPIAFTAGIGLAGLTPHFVFATGETGSPLGILFFTADVAGRDYWGQGLVDYFLQMGWPLGALVGPAAVVFFIWWLVVARNVVTERTRCLFLMIPAAGQVLLLGIVSHGEPRFIFFPYALTLIGGVIGFRVVREGWDVGVARAITLGMVILLVGALGLSAAHVRAAVENRAANTVPIEAAADELRGIAGDASCGVMTTYQPQVTFYSECSTHSFRTDLEPEEALNRMEGEEQFLLVVEDGKRQPTGDALAGFIDLTVGPPVVVEGGPFGVEIFDFAP